MQALLTGRDCLQRWLGTVVILLSAALLAGCTTGYRGGPIPYEVEDFGRPDAAALTVLDSDYRITPLDTLDVKVFNVAELSGEYQVDLTGHIGMPLIGNVKAVDLTPGELQDRLIARLGERYLRNPDITVGIKRSASRNVTVEGAVARPGMFPVMGPTSLIQAIAMAGGVHDNGNPRRVAIFRQIDGQRQAAAFDLVSIRRGKSEDPAIYTGDIVVVDGSNLKAMQREILMSIPIIGLFNPFLF